MTIPPDRPQPRPVRLAVLIGLTALLFLGGGMEFGFNFWFD
ncbi:hypothetical protein [Gemmobacter denitrificans]|uniref:Uncharacterized protein n=1 Tax=Gemmobacter denitrificans TaxID=3123040 RepID=A0ABU8BZI7_9RHOB